MLSQEAVDRLEIGVGFLFLAAQFAKSIKRITTACKPTLLLLRG